jgi:hypothetical protein
MRCPRSFVLIAEDLGGAGVEVRQSSRRSSSLPESSIRVPAVNCENVGSESIRRRQHRGAEDPGQQAQQPQPRVGDQGPDRDLRAGAGEDRHADGRQDTPVHAPLGG